MKKLLAIITIVACVATLAGCSLGSKKNKDVITNEATEENTVAPTQVENTTAAATKKAKKAKKNETTQKATQKVTNETPPQKSGKKKTKAKGGNIVGSWTFEGGVFVYIFNKDGSGVFTSGSGAKHFTYKTSGNKVKLTYKDGKKITYPYTVKGNMLYLKDEYGDDMPYKKNKKHPNPNK